MQGELEVETHFASKHLAGEGRLAEEGCLAEEGDLAGASQVSSARVRCVACRSYVYQDKLDKHRHVLQP